MKRIGWCLALIGCLDTDVELPPPIELLGVSPALDVPEDATVTLAFSGAIHRSGSRWPIAVVQAERAASESERRREGRAWPGPGPAGREEQEIPIQIEGAERAITIAPSPRWPPGAALEIRLAKGLVDEHGRPVPTAHHTFSVRPAVDRTPQAVVRAPTPGTPAPLNLSFVAVAEGGGEAFLELDSHRIPLAPERSLEGVTLYRLPAYQAPCRPLCPETVHRLRIEGSEIAEGPLGEVATGTITDDRPPEIVATKVVFRGGQPWVEICADEPVLVRGEADGPGGSIPYVAPLVASERVLAKPLFELDPGTAHDLLFEVEDLARNRAPPIRVPLVTPPRIAISISEIVASPLRDWNDGEGGGTPLDPFPGVGAVSDSDEWIELVNLSEAPIDLTTSGIELRALDATPSVTPLAGAPEVFFGDGGSIFAWRPGEAMVLRARGAMSSRELVVEVAAEEQLFDRVVIGRQTGADHPGGSPPNVFFESIARTDSGRFGWCLPTPGDPLPARHCDH